MPSLCRDTPCARPPKPSTETSARRNLSRSNLHIASISAANPQIDTTKPRVGSVVTLEPYYLNQNWLMWDQLPMPKFPVGAISVGELASLVCLGADELLQVLRAAADPSRENVLLLANSLAAADGRENPLLFSTWESIGLFGRADAAAKRLRAEGSHAE